MKKEEEEILFQNEIVTVFKPKPMVLEIGNTKEELENFQVSIGNAE